ncbi:hypothetical protein VB773_17980 [Haloarculaceae archaeon H-GB2-1]|nr:hypothetical protein [Haloarculaceae archaeon H-GB2-1]
MMYRRRVLGLCAALAVAGCLGEQDGSDDLDRATDGGVRHLFGESLDLDGINVAVGGDGSVIAVGGVLGSVTNYDAAGDVATYDTGRFWNEVGCDRTGKHVLSAWFADDVVGVVSAAADPIWERSVPDLNVAGGVTTCDSSRRVCAPRPDPAASRCSKTARNAGGSTSETRRSRRWRSA